MRYDGLAPRLVHYLIAINLLGLLTACVMIGFSITHISFQTALWIALLLPIATVAERFPMHLTHKTNVNMASAAYIATILILPTPMPGAIAFIAACIAQRLRRPEPPEAMFNVNQTTLYVSAAAVVYAVTSGWNLGPEIGTFGSSGSIVLASVVLHITNTALVSLAGAFQLALHPLRVWWVNLGLDLMPHITLTTLGVIAALVSLDRPLLIPFLALPAVLVQNSVRQSAQLRADTHEALASLVEVLEIRDPYTAGHSRRVAMFSRTIALHLGMAAEEADLIEQSGRVHDIGKAAVDTNILTKEGMLDDQEWEQVRMHPVHGANVVERFVAYRDAAVIVRHHHESWDGAGYPDGLSGDAIPMGSRIIAVADAFDALTTDRPYRGGMSVDSAILVLEFGAGVQWDPRVVSTFCAYLGETAGEIPSYRAPITEQAQRIESAAAPRGAVASASMRSGS